MWDNNIKSDNTIRGSCPHFACRCCRTKQGYPHQIWCELYTLTQPECRDCFYYSEVRGVCRHPAQKYERKERRKHEDN